MKSVMLRVLLIIFGVAVGATNVHAAKNANIILNNSGSQVLLITEGVSGKPLSGKILQQNKSGIMWQAENGLSCKIGIKQNSETIEYDLKFTATGKKAHLLNVQLKNQCNLSGDIIFWDGFEEHKLNGTKKKAERSDLTETFPLACAYNGKNGVALGVTPDTIVSSLNCGIKREKNTTTIFYKTKIVVDNRRAQKLGFVSYDFSPEFGWRNAVQDFYTLYPSYFKPAPGIDKRIYGVGGYYTSAHAQRELELHAARHTFMTWEWTYAPWCRAGDWYVDKADWKNDDLHFFDKWYGIRKPRKTTWEEYHNARVKQFEVGNKMCAMFYYVLVKDIFEDIVKRFPESQYVNNSGHTISTSGLYSLPSNRNKTKLAFAYGSGLAKYLENEIKQVVENYQISGFAFDMANWAVNFYNKSQLNYAVGRSFDKQGKIYTSDSVLPIPFADYIHTLFRNKKQMGVYMNFALCNVVASTVFHTDGVMFEGLPDRYYEHVLPLRLMSGKKPFTFWGHVTGGANTGIKKMYYDNPKTRKDILKGLAQLLLLKCLEYGATPSNWAATYENGTFFEKWIPVLEALKKAGWNPVPAVRIKGTDKLWTGRFGEGINTFITISNPSRETLSADCTVINSYLGTEKYFFVPVFPYKLKQIIDSSSTRFPLQLAPKEAIVLRAVELTGTDNATIEVASATDSCRIDFVSTDKKGCSIKGKRYNPTGKSVGIINTDMKDVGIKIMPEYFVADKLRDGAQLVLKYVAQTALLSSADKISDFFSITDSGIKDKCPVIVLSKLPSEQAKTIAEMTDRYYPYVQASIKYCRKNWSAEPGFLDAKFVNMDKLQILQGKKSPKGKIIYIGDISSFPELGGKLSKEEKQQLSLCKGGFIKLLDKQTLWIGGKDSQGVFAAGQKYFSLLDSCLENTEYVNFRKPHGWSINKLGTSFVKGEDQQYLRIVACPGTEANKWLYSYYTFPVKNSEETIRFSSIIKCKNLKGLFKLGVREVDKKGKTVRNNFIDISKDCDWKDITGTVKIKPQTNIIQFYFVGRNMEEGSEILVRSLNIMRKSAEK
jgi:hypothetical protein